MKASSLRKPAAPAFQMFLRIKHPSLHPSDITDAVGLEPEHVQSAGRSVSSSGVERLHTESYWIAELPATIMADLVASLTAEGPRSGLQLGKEGLPDLGVSEYEISMLTWLRRLDSKRAFFQQLCKDGGSVTLLIQRRDPARPFFARRALAQLADFGIGLEID